MLTVNTKHIRLLHVDKYVNNVKCVPAQMHISRHACSNYYLKKTHTIQMSHDLRLKQH